MHIYKNKIFEYIAGLRFRNFTVYDDTEVDVTNVDGLVELIKSGL